MNETIQNRSTTNSTKHSTCQYWVLPWRVCRYVSAGRAVTSSQYTKLSSLCTRDFSLFWHVTQHWYVVIYRCFGTANWYHLQGSINPSDPWRRYRQFVPKRRPLTTNQHGATSHSSQNLKLRTLYLAISNVSLPFHRSVYKTGQTETACVRDTFRGTCGDTTWGDTGVPRNEPSQALRSVWLLRKEKRPNNWHIWRPGFRAS
jgi:hypothetical protein